MTTLNIKKLISFDVGIKNMAYCIFDIDLSNNPFSINEWKIMNMLESESQEITKTCNCEITIKKKEIL